MQNPPLLCGVELSNKTRHSQVNVKANNATISQNLRQNIYRHKINCPDPPLHSPFETSKWTISDQKSRQNRNKPWFMQVRKRGLVSIDLHTKSTTQLQIKFKISLPFDNFRSKLQSSSSSSLNRTGMCFFPGEGSQLAKTDLTYSQYQISHNSQNHNPHI